MPELPEVETVVCGLRERMVGREIRSVQLNRPDLRIPFPPFFDEILEGQRITNVTRRAKYMLFHLEDGHQVLAHLGMSGTMRFAMEDEYEPRNHDHVLWELEGGEFFIFRDPRRFGLMTLIEPDQGDVHPLLAHLGPEPLDRDAFTPHYLAEALAKRKSAVKVALMDQELVVGVGNIYASEALFRAGVHPSLSADSQVENADKIVASIREVLAEAIASGGSTLRDYVRSDGDLGYFQHAFRVYDREKQPCMVCGCAISRFVQAGRASYACEVCQPCKKRRKTKV